MAIEQEQLAILFDSGWSKQVRVPFPTPESVSHFGEVFTLHGRLNGLPLYVKSSSDGSTKRLTADNKQCE